MTHSAWTLISHVSVATVHILHAFREVCLSPLVDYPPWSCFILSQWCSFNESHHQLEDLAIMVSLQSIYMTVSSRIYNAMPLLSALMITCLPMVKAITWIPKILIIAFFVAGRLQIWFLSWFQKIREEKGSIQIFRFCFTAYLSFSFLSPTPTHTRILL